MRQKCRVRNLMSSCQRPDDKRKRLHRSTGKFWKEMTMLCILIMVVVTWLNMLVKIHWPLYLKAVNFILCKLYLKKCDFKYIHTHTPRAQTLVVMRTFSFPSRNLWRTEARWSTVSSPLNRDTWWPSCAICTLSHLASWRVYMKDKSPGWPQLGVFTMFVCAG